ncbi:hypothetical protein J6590_044744 [Homalodisca vitripennis]|nr:hypothetical protein J6590_044744 [Homalodisca vitripennis]
MWNRVINSYNGIERGCCLEIGDLVLASIPPARPWVVVRKSPWYFGIIPTTPRHESLFHISFLLITRLA